MFDKQTLKYSKALLLHLIIGIIIFYIKPLGLVFNTLVIFYGIFSIVKTNNKDNQALYMSAYIMSMEVFLRMTEGALSHEVGKYTIILYMLLGMYYSGFKKGALLYFIFILLLLPSIFIAIDQFGSDVNIRKAIVFNTLGPLTLAISAMYCYNREVTIQQIKKIFIYFSFPIICILVQVFLYKPMDEVEIFRNTTSNFETSGGFGPNQVSTILGFGMFIFFTNLLINSKNKLLLLINGILFLVCTYRGIITFSRGGVYVGLVMIIFLLIAALQNTHTQAKRKIAMLISVGALAGMLLWSYTNIVTGGLIEKRYANEDALGREKESKLSGRENLIESEFQMFFENPIFGVGVGRNKEVRKEMTGIHAASHNEISRMLAEHGSLGIAGLLLLIAVPLTLYFKNRENIFLLSFFLFWALTINHAAMRLAAPAFIYALSLLNVRFHEEAPLYRE